MNVEEDVWQKDSLVLKRKMYAWIFYYFHISAIYNFSSLIQDQSSFPLSRSAAQSQIHAHTRTVVEPESEDSGSEYEYEYEYDENVYSDDPAYDDTLGSTPGGPYTATMSGYYFHQHSEPWVIIIISH